MFGREDETELRLVRRGEYLYPDRNYDYFVLKRMMFTANLSQSRGIRLRVSSDQLDKVLAVAERTVCVTYVDPDCSHCGGTGVCETELYEGLVNCCMCYPEETNG